MNLKSRVIADVEEEIKDKRQRYEDSLVGGHLRVSQLGADADVLGQDKRYQSATVFLSQP